MAFRNCEKLVRNCKICNRKDFCRVDRRVAGVFYERKSREMCCDRPIPGIAPAHHSPANTLPLGLGADRSLSILHLCHGQGNRRKSATYAAMRYGGIPRSVEVTVEAGERTVRQVTDVIPAKAGIHEPVLKRWFSWIGCWIPAFARMTKRE